MAMNPDEVTSATLKLWCKTPIAGEDEGTEVGDWPGSAGAKGVTSIFFLWNPHYHLSVINGEDIVRFAGSEDQLGVNNDPILGISPSGFCTFMVMENDSNTDARYPCCDFNNAPLGGGYGWWLIENSVDNDSITVGVLDANGTQTVTKTSANVTDWHIICAQGTWSGDLSLYVNGGLAGTASLGARADSTVQRYRMCAWHNNTGELNGDIAEWIVYDGELSDVDRAGVTAYLSAKYGISTTLILTVNETANVEENIVKSTSKYFSSTTELSDAGLYKDVSKYLSELIHGLAWGEDRLFFRLWRRACMETWLRGIWQDVYKWLAEPWTDKQRDSTTGWDKNTCPPDWVATTEFSESSKEDSALWSETSAATADWEES